MVSSVKPPGELVECAGGDHRYDQSRCCPVVPGPAPSGVRCGSGCLQDRLRRGYSGGCALCATDRPARTMHNLYPLLYNEAVAQVTQEERGHSAVWGRAAIGGSQRTPVCWSGDPAADFDSLACTVRGGLSMGLSGVPFWSNDIGGYRGMPRPRPVCPLGTIRTVLFAQPHARRQSA